MKKIRYYILTAVCLFLGACGGDDEIDAPVVTPDEPETQVIKITHEASKFDMPELIFSGSSKLLLSGETALPKITTRIASISMKRKVRIPSPSKVPVSKKSRSRV